LQWITFQYLLLQYPLKGQIHKLDFFLKKEIQELQIELPSDYHDAFVALSLSDTDLENFGEVDDLSI
jgi:hypothetical protein